MLQRASARYGYRRLFIVYPPGPLNWVQLFRLASPGRASARWMHGRLVLRMQLGRWVLLAMPRGAELAGARAPSPVTSP